MHGFSTGEETVASSMEIVKDELMKLKKNSQAENSFFIAEENVVESSSKLQEALRKNSLSHAKSMWQAWQAYMSWLIWI